jgi:biotin carboxylase
VTAARRKLLLAGGSHADIPMIRAAQALGYHVTTSGNRPGDLGHAHADATELADFSDPEAIRDLAARLDVDALVASCNDFSALSCAWAAEQLGLPGHDRYETACTLHHKDLYRAFALANGVDTPRAAGCASVAAARASAAGLRYPLIVKPVDLTGGKGISVARDPGELDAAVERALAMTRAGRIVIEEFLEGSRHGFTSMLREGKVAFHFQDNEHYFLNPYLVSAASTPAAVPQETGAKLVATTERVAGLLGLVDGIVHIQYILHAGEPVIIEICRRPPGDLYVDLVRHATGVDYPGLIVRAACGMPLDDVVQVEPRGAYLRHCVMSREAGRLEDLHIDPSVKGKIVDEMLWWKRGELITDVMTWKAGILFFRFDGEAEMRDLSARMPDLVRPVLAN